MPAHLKAELLTQYDRYITDEVLPLIRKDCGQHDTRPITTGASLGAFLAANTYFKHPDAFRGTIAMSGSYDIKSYLHGYFDENVYFNNPLDYLPGLNDDHFLPILRHADASQFPARGAAPEAHASCLTYFNPRASLHSDIKA